MIKGHTRSDPNSILRLDQNVTRSSNRHRTNPKHLLKMVARLSTLSDQRRRFNPRTAKDILFKQAGLIDEFHSGVQIVLIEKIRGGLKQVGVRRAVPLIVSTPNESRSPIAVARGMIVRNRCGKPFEIAWS